MSYHLKFGWVAPAVAVTINPMPHTRMVLVTSPIDLASALMYLVTVTPVMLKVAMENIPKMQKNKSEPLENASWKYISGLSRKG